MRAGLRVGLAAMAVAILGIAPCWAGASPVAGGDEPPSAQTLWRADLGRAVGREIALGESCAFAATLDGRIGAVRLADGRRLWRKRHGDGLPGGVIVDGQHVLAVSDEPDGRLYCLSAATGDLLWSADVGPSFTAPVVRAGLVLTAGLHGRVTACSLESGEIVWQRPVPGQIRAPLAIAGELVLVPTLEDTLVALQVRSGDLAWGAAPGGAVYGRPLVDDRGVWTLSYEGELVCWDASTGREVDWVQLEGPFRCGAVVAGDALLAVATGGRVTALDRATLAERWHVDLAGAAWLEPLVEGDRLWQALGDRTLRGLRLADGSEIERHELPHAPSTCPIRAGEQLLVGLGSGHLLALSSGSAGASNATGAARPAEVDGARSSSEVRDPARLSERSGTVGPFEARADLVAAAGLRAGENVPRPLEAVPFWQRDVILASPPASGPAVATPASGGGPRLTGAGPIWAAGWIAGTAVALWLQHEAEQAHETYERTGDPGRREDELERAERLDRAVLGVWIASEAMFLLMLRNWLGGGE